VNSTPPKFRLLRRYLSRSKGELALALLALAFVAGTSLVFPWLLKLMVDTFNAPEREAYDIGTLALGLGALFVVSSLLGYYQQITMSRLGFRLRNEMRADLYKTLLDQSLHFHRNQQVGELSARATEDIGKVQHIYSSLIAPITQNLLIVGGGVVLTLMLNATASLILIFFLFLPIPLVIRFSKRIRSLAAESQSSHAEANASFEESLVAIREVKALVLEGQKTSVYQGFLQAALTRELEASRLIFRGTQTAYFLLSAMLLVMFYLSGVQALPGWTLGSMVAFFFYSYTIAMALLSTGRIYLVYQNVIGALERVASLLKSTGEGETLTGALPPLQGRLCLDNVLFGYDKYSAILYNATLEINPGQWIVIAGPSGSGKSTIASLIMGFYQPWSGKVRFDGTEMNPSNVRSVRRQVGYVGQDPFLFRGTLRDNITAGIPHPCPDIDRILEVTCLDEVIRELPEGIETLVGERGYTLSGGQKARVAIARALACSPPVLILDEANAMMGAHLERRFWAHLMSFRPAKTTIILSHHVELIPRIDRFFTIRQGTILEHPSPPRHNESDS